MPTPSYDFRNKAAVVTGAGGGMGEAIALALAQAGAAVTAIDVKPCPESLKKSDAVFDDIPQIKPEKEMVDLAKELIGRKSGAFDPGAVWLPDSPTSTNTHTARSPCAAIIHAWVCRSAPF